MVEAANVVEIMDNHSTRHCIVSAYNKLEAIDSTPENLWNSEWTRGNGI